jgi:hypothetical protein
LKKPKLPSPFARPRLPCSTILLFPKHRPTLNQSQSASSLFWLSPPSPRHQTLATRPTSPARRPPRSPSLGSPRTKGQPWPPCPLSKTSQPATAHFISRLNTAAASAVLQLLPSPPQPRSPSSGQPQPPSPHRSPPTDPTTAAADLLQRQSASSPRPNRSLQ